MDRHDIRSPFKPDIRSRNSARFCLIMKTGFSKILLALTREIFVSINFFDLFAVSTGQRSHLLADIYVGVSLEFLSSDSNSGSLTLLCRVQYLVHFYLVHLLMYAILFTIFEIYLCRLLPIVLMHCAWIIFSLHLRDNSEHALTVINT